jgi:hypothetical protein
MPVITALYCGWSSGKSKFYIVLEHLCHSMLLASATFFSESRDEAPVTMDNYSVLHEARIRVFLIRREPDELQSKI